MILPEEAAPFEQQEPALFIEQVHPTLRVDEDALERLIRQALSSEARPLRYLGIVLTDRETVWDLNRTYLGHDYPTDVLSFPLGDQAADDAVDGEVYVDLDTADERHAEFGMTFEGEVRRYVLHGVLHLLGYDDATPLDKQTMTALEDRYLALPSYPGPDGPAPSH